MKAFYLCGIATVWGHALLGGWQSFGLAELHVSQHTEYLL